MLKKPGRDSTNLCKTSLVSLFLSFCIWCKLGKSRSIQLLVEKRITALNFQCSRPQISSSVPSWVQSTIIKWTSQNRQQPKNCWYFFLIFLLHKTFWIELAIPFDIYPSKPQKVDRIGLSFSCLLKASFNSFLWSVGLISEMITANEGKVDSSQNVHHQVFYHKLQTTKSCCARWQIWGAERAYLH